MKGPVLEVTLVFLGALATLALSHSLGGIPGPVGQNSGLLVASYFLFVPLAVLRWRNLDPSAFGIHGRKPFVALLWALIVALAVFPPYVLAYEVWSRVIDRTSFRLPTHPLAYYEAIARLRPQLPSAEKGILVWFEGEALFVVNMEPTKITLRLEGCGCPVQGLKVEEGGLFLRSPLKGCGSVITGEVESSHGWKCPTEYSGRIILSVTSPLEGSEFRLGASMAPRPGATLVLDRSPFWLLETFLVNFVGIALPEEVFYRGYLQGRLGPLFRRRFRLLGVEVGGHLFVASVLFAISHLVTVHHPFRLAVFFPGLLFGWLREKTQGILAPAFLHASSNCLMEALQRFHGS